MTRRNFLAPSVGAVGVDVRLGLALPLEHCTSGQN